MREDSLTEALMKVKELASIEKICALSEKQADEYRARLAYFKTVNGTKSSASQKGTALEELVSCLLRLSGDVLRIAKNVRTSTNEIDEIIELNEKGKILLKCGTLQERYTSFLGECKNYRKTIDVTYVGKFYSLLQTTSVRTGILFSYHGVSGSGWTFGSGLIRHCLKNKSCTKNRCMVS